MAPIRVVSPQLQVPVLDAPRLARIDVSSGIGALAEGLGEYVKVERAAKLNATQIDLSNRFRELANELRSTPAEQMRACAPRRRLVAW